MSLTAIYDMKTGFITSTLNQPLSNLDQIAALQERGLGVTTIPDNKNGGTGMIDLATTGYVDFLPPPNIPNIHYQIAAALINAGVVSVDNFHPTTIAEMDTALTSVNMMAVSAKITGATVTS